MSLRERGWREEVILEEGGGWNVFLCANPRDITHSYKGQFQPNSSDFIHSSLRYLPAHVFPYSFILKVRAS